MEEIHTVDIQEPVKVELQEETGNLLATPRLEASTDNSIKEEATSEACTNNGDQPAIPLTETLLSSGDVKSENIARSIENSHSELIIKECNESFTEGNEDVPDNSTQISDGQIIQDGLIREEHIIEEYIETKLVYEPIKDESTNCTESEEHMQEKDAATTNKEEAQTMLNMDPNDANNAQCQALIKSFTENLEKKEHSIDVGDTDLTKLVDGNSEVVVLTVEAVPTSESNDGIEENFVVTVHEKDGNIVSLEGKEGKKSDVNQEFDLIDYSQEGDDTIIEVISTEVVQSEIPETCTDQESKDESRSLNAEMNSAGTTEEEHINNVEVVDDKNDNRQIEAEVPAVGSKEDEMAEAEPKTNINIKTEACDNKDKSKLKKDIVPTKVVTPASVDYLKQSSISVNKSNKVETTNKNRSVIQDIFDDWGDENVEEDSQVAPKVQDTVEIELKSLLDDAKTGQTITEETVVIVEEEITTTDKECDTSPSVRAADTVKDKKELQVLNEQTENQNTKKQISHSTVPLLNKDQISFSISQKLGKLPKNVAQDSNALNQTSQLHVIPVASRNRNLTSQIASQAEVAEALKERLKEKQKLVEPPRGPDIFFVKKLTQRLSSKLAGGPVSSIPALIPLPNPSQSSTNNCDRKTTDATNTVASKESSDNKELLAILEGDVDPDWSNLKPPTLTAENKGPVPSESAGHNTPPKLDPLVERELALKQLLELPVTTTKKSAAKKKKPLKPTPQKASKQSDAKKISEESKKIQNVDGIVAEQESPVKDPVDSKPTVPSGDVKQGDDTKKTPDATSQDMRVEESRSGRRRKPTEKAREHEQNTTKRQKVQKSKVSVSKKQTEENDVAADSSLLADDVLAKENEEPVNVNNEATPTKDAGKEIINKQSTNKMDSTINTPKSVPIKRPKQNLSKKGSQPIAKRKLVVKKLIRPNMPSNKKAVNMKAKISSAQKKSASKIVSKSQKRPADSTSADSKPKKKIINEIDRLLQDEGVVNLLYDVEQPDKKRLVPITKSHAKVMDIQKVQRELKIRKKLVRNAVLRLRTSASGASKVSPRSKRTVHVSDIQMDKKAVEQVTSTKAANATAASEFIIPAKIRNAADASIIIRRHSSSSFSSASGSPRVSIDGPEKADGGKSDEGGTHTLRSTKRRHSQDDATNAKKSKKKAVQKTDTDLPIPVPVEDKASTVPRPSKKSDSKKVDKSLKQTEMISADENNSSPSKVVTRSNGTTTGKITSKSKKTPKNKVNFAKPSEPDNNEESSKEEDELSACLAEAATALSVVSANNRSGTAAANRKSKVPANVAKILDPESSKPKSEVRNQFVNKEINVRKHGYLVQLILTPSSSTKIRNALTLQVMQEFRETLSILKKDDECRVVLLTSTGTSFCEGLDLSMLLHTNKDERRLRAQEIADAVKDFIKSLATFNKPIVAGVQGAAVGLGVTMLPLFDLVIASDKATFCTPYGKLGQIAEGAAVFTLSHILGSAITSELLLGGRTLTASEALRAGLVTRVLWPDRFQVELLPTLRAMSEQSSQSMEATKALLRHSLRKKLDAALESETYLLIQHWCSTECQTAIKAYIDGKVQ